jgi:hypothetical protein
MEAFIGVSAPVKLAVSITLVRLNGEGDGAAATIAAVKSRAFGAPLRGCGT